jgi:hypothetical protein
MTRALGLILWLTVPACGDPPNVPRCDEGTECASLRKELARLQTVCWEDPASEPRMMIPRPRMAYAGCCGDAAGKFEAKCGLTKEQRTCVERWSEACPAGFHP